MFYLNRIYLLITGLVLFIICTPNNSHSQAKVGGIGGGEHLRVVNSPKGSAMGQCAANLVDAQSALYNPGAYGVFLLNKTFHLSFPNKTDYFPYSDNSQIYLKTFSLGAGISLKKISKSSRKGDFDIALGFAYSRIRLDIGEVTRTGFDIIVIGAIEGTGETIAIYDNTDCYTIGLGIKYFANVGAGITFKRLTEFIGEVAAKANMHDIGIYFEIPIFDILSDKPESQKKINFDLTPSFAYVKANIGKITYPANASSQYLPKMSRVGFSVYAAANSGKMRLISVRWINETEKGLWVYSDESKKNGYEVGVLGIFYYRWGNAKNDIAGIDQDTWGYGIELRGLLYWGKTCGLRIPKGFAGKILNNIDFSFEFAKFPDNGYYRISNAKFYKLSMSF